MRLSRQRAQEVQQRAEGHVAEFGADAVGGVGVSGLGHIALLHLRKPVQGVIDIGDVLDGGFSGGHVAVNNPYQTPIYQKLSSFDLKFRNETGFNPIRQH